MRSPRGFRFLRSKTAVFSRRENRRRRRKRKQNRSAHKETLSPQFGSDPPTVHHVKGAPIGAPFCVVNRRVKEEPLAVFAFCEAKRRCSAAEKTADGGENKRTIIKTRCTSLSPQLGSDPLSGENKKFSAHPMVSAMLY